MAVKRIVYQRKVDVDMLNAVKSMLADVSSVSPLSEQRAMKTGPGSSQSANQGAQFLRIPDRKKSTFLRLHPMASTCSCPVINNAYNTPTQLHRQFSSQNIVSRQLGLHGNKSKQTPVHITFKTRNTVHWGANSRKIQLSIWVT